jgi:hypothetical protein
MIASAVGIIAFIAGIIGVAFILHADSHVAGSVIARPLDWMPPLVTLLVIAGVGWILVAQRRPDDGQSGSGVSTRCPACEREVLGKWRMCPYCGAMLERPAPGVASSAGQADR